MASARNSSIELLRLILMLMIVVMHCNTLGFNIDDPVPERRLISVEEPCRMMMDFVVALCFCAVNCFVLISGYFSIRLSVGKIIRLLGIVLFYTILLAVIPDLLAGRYRAAVFDLLILSHSPYWFIPNYIFLMLFAPMINLMFEKMRKRDVNLVLAGLLFINCYIGFFWSGDPYSGGYTLFQFITMYCVGRWIATNGFTLSRPKAVALYVGSSLVLAAEIYGLWFWRIWTVSATSYNNPVAMLSAIGLFFIFKGIRLESRTINSWAQSALAVYLVQCSVRVGGRMYGYLRELAASAPMWRVWVAIMVISVLVTAAALLIDRIRIRLFALCRFIPTRWWLVAWRRCRSIRGSRRGRG